MPRVDFGIRRVDKVQSWLRGRVGLDSNDVPSAMVTVFAHAAD